MRRTMKVLAGSTLSTLLVAGSAFAQVTGNPLDPPYRAEIPTTVPRLDPIPKSASDVNPIAPPPLRWPGEGLPPPPGAETDTEIGPPAHPGWTPAGKLLVPAPPTSAITRKSVTADENRTFWYPAQPYFTHYQAPYQVWTDFHGVTVFDYHFGR